VVLIETVLRIVSIPQMSCVQVSFVTMLLDFRAVLMIGIQEKVKLC